MIGGRTQREPYDCTHAFWVKTKPSICSPKYWTMSFRSGSPWTRTSSPISSWKATTLSISARIRSSYSASWISPSRSRRRVARISSVWGNEPIVVAGKVGMPIFCCCACLRSANGESRRASASVRASTRARTSGVRVRCESRRESSALSLASS